MIFLIEYNRAKGKIVHLTTFSDSDRIKAENVRLNVELDLRNKNVTHEVVLLEALSEAALRRTHRRYFENPRSIAHSFK